MLYICTSNSHRPWKCPCHSVYLTSFSLVQSFISADLSKPLLMMISPPVFCFFPPFLRRTFSWCFTNSCRFSSKRSRPRRSRPASVSSGGTTNSPCSGPPPSPWRHLRLQQPTPTKSMSPNLLLQLPARPPPNATGGTGWGGARAAVQKKKMHQGRIQTTARVMTLRLFRWIKTMITLKKWNCIDTQTHCLAIWRLSSL